MRRLAVAPRNRNRPMRRHDSECEGPAPAAIRRQTKRFGALPPAESGDPSRGASMRGGGRAESPAAPGAAAGAERSRSARNHNRADEKRPAGDEDGGVHQVSAAKTGGSRWKVPPPVGASRTSRWRTRRSAAARRGIARPDRSLPAGASGFCPRISQKRTAWPRRPRASPLSPTIPAPARLGLPGVATTELRIVPGAGGTMPSASGARAAPPGAESSTSRSSSNRWSCPHVASSVWVPVPSVMPLASGPHPDTFQALSLELLGRTDCAEILIQTGSPTSMRNQVGAAAQRGSEPGATRA